MEENRRWLIDQEARLFKIRLQKAMRHATSEEVLMKLKDIFGSEGSSKQKKIEPVSSHEWEQMKEIAGDYLEGSASGQIYKVSYRSDIKKLLTMAY